MKLKLFRKNCKIVFKHIQKNKKKDFYIHLMLMQIKNFLLFISLLTFANGLNFILKEGIEKCIYEEIPADTVKFDSSNILNRK